MFLIENQLFLPLMEEISGNEPPEKKKELSPLAKKLIRQKTKENYHGLFSPLKITMAVWDD